VEPPASSLRTPLARAVFAIGPYSFRPSSKILLNQSGAKVRLTEKETAILRYLYRAGQKAVPRETLLQEVWGYDHFPTTRTVDAHIVRLRQKLESIPEEPKYILTVHGTGYKFVG